MTGGEFASRADVDEIIISNCQKCGVQSFLQKDFEVCPHCLDWNHENDPDWRDGRNTDQKYTESDQ